MRPPLPVSLEPKPIMALVTLPIRAVIFDLDGTLVQTERLKASSYA